MSEQSLSSNDRALKFIAASLDMQRVLFQHYDSASTDDCIALANDLIAQAQFIADFQKCALGEVIWLRVQPFSTEHNMAVLAAVRAIGEDADKKNNKNASLAALYLRAMTMLSCAKTLSENEETKLQVLAHSHALGQFADELMQRAEKARS